MVISSFIFFYFFLKIILTKNLNEINFPLQIQNTRNEKTAGECVTFIASTIYKDKISQEEINEIILCVLVIIRDEPGFAGNIINTIRDYAGDHLQKILIQNNRSFLCDLADDAFRNESRLYDDSPEVIVNNKEFINYSIVLVKTVMVGKNITLDELLKYIYNITNIPGMDNVFGHIVNSIHNGALFLLVEKLLNGTRYGNFFNSIKDVIIYPYKVQIIRLIHEILKSGLFITDNEPKDEEKINKIRNTLESIRNFINSIKNIIYENREDILNRTNLTSLYNLTIDIFDENSTFIDDLFDLIEKHPELVNHTVTLIKGGLTGDITKFIVLDTIKKIFNVEGLKELIIDKLKKYFYDIVPLIPKEVNERPTVIPLLIDLKDFIMKYQDRLVDFIYQIFTHYMNYTEIAKDINNFIINCTLECISSLSINNLFQKF